MALAFTVREPSGYNISRNGKIFLDFKSEFQYFKITYTGAASNDKIYISEKQDGSNWTTLSETIIANTGAGDVKDVVGPFRLNGNNIRVHATNSAGNTTYQTNTFEGPDRKISKRRLKHQSNDLLDGDTVHSVKNRQSILYLPALEDAVAKVVAENNAIITSTTVVSSMNTATTYLDKLPHSIKMGILGGQKMVFMGVNYRKWEDTNADGVKDAYVNYPLIVAKSKVYTFAEQTSDKGKGHADNFMKVFASCLGKRTYAHLRAEDGPNGARYGTYGDRRDDYEAVANAKVTALF
jgi:hypothetical protein